MEKLTIDAKEAADLLGVDEDRLYRLLDKRIENELPCCKIGKVWKFCQPLLVEWDEERREEEKWSKIEKSLDQIKSKHEKEELLDQILGTSSN